MKIPIYQVDAFTGRRFGGNPAAVCPLDGWPEDALLQAIAAENNLSETAFVAPEEGEFRLRWFTPLAEVALCGHATLATAYVLFHYLRPELASVRFRTLSGVLTAAREGDLVVMDFPVLPSAPATAPDALLEGLGAVPLETRIGRDYLVVYSDEATVRGLRPDFAFLARLETLGTIVTAPGGDCDFVSRFFAPRVGIDEDPVTGSAHCLLAPYWAERLGKRALHARQVSPRGGELFCRLEGERVFLSGRAVPYLEGWIEV